MLCDAYRRYAVNVKLWNSKDDKWRQRKFLNFMEDSLGIGKAEKIIKTRKTIGIAKKPGQRKRAKSEKF